MLFTRKPRCLCHFRSMFAGMNRPEQFKQLIALPEWEGHVFVLHSNRDDGSIYIGLGCEEEFTVQLPDEHTLLHFQQWLDSKKDWAFGYLSYDLKNVLENLSTSPPNNSGFPDIHFIRPKLVIQILNETISIRKNNTALDSDTILQLLHAAYLPELTNATIRLEARISHEQYIAAVEHLLQHIQLGDIYEVNYCQEFFGVEKIQHPYELWLRMNSFTEAPFAAYMQNREKYLMCASPERFLRKKGHEIISQPIKGTIRRGQDLAEDELLKKELHSNPKERSENVMIVDLVRNDLAHVAEKASVRVEELFGIYTFKTVHHMVSTVAATLRDNVSFTDVIRALFPMGSMTGAPKIRAMELIDTYEYNRRGVYSGSMGYISPEGDFDFNVVIRSLVYNDTKPYLSCCVGSAITSQCDPQKEYEECLLKAEALFKALRSDQHQEANTTSSASQIARTAN